MQLRSLSCHGGIPYHNQSSKEAKDFNSDKRVNVSRGFHALGSLGIKFSSDLMDFITEVPNYLK